MRCPFGVRDECPFFESTKEMKEKPDLVKLFCSMCIKAAYAKAHLQYSSRDFKVVNTL